MMDKVVASFKIELSRLRAGRAHPDFLSHLTIEQNGKQVQLPHVASIKLVDSLKLSVTPWNSSLLPLIEKAIRNSSLGLNPCMIGKAIMVTMPVMTEERRRELIKLSHQKAEEARVSIRAIRRELLNNLKLLSKDETRREEQKIQAQTDSHINEISTLLKQKEADLLVIG